jgi:hypothetical protein
MKKPKTLRFTPRIFDALKRAAVDKEVTQNLIVTTALKEWLIREGYLESHSITSESDGQVHMPHGTSIEEDDTIDF